MRYNLTAISFNNKRAKTIIARQLAHDPSIPLQKALEMVEKPPFILLKNLTSQELEYQSEQLSRLGVKFTITEIQSSEPVHQIPISLPNSDFPIKSADLHPSTHNEVNFQKEPYALKKSSPLIFNDTPVQHSRKNNLIISGAAILFIVSLIVGGIMVFSKQRHYSLKQKVLIAYNGSDPINKGLKKETVKSNTVIDSRKNVSSKARFESNLLVDSARIYENDYLKAINFYKIAISFNKYNIHAWFGLLNVYRSAEMKLEAQQTRDKMQEIFGNSVFSVTETVKEFGDVIDIYTTEDNVLRVEYKTAQSSKYAILNETYTLAKAFREICNCKSISIFATTTPGSGMIVHVNTNTSLLTIDSFKNEASVNFLQ